MGVTHFAYRLSVDGHSGCFHFLAIKNDSQNAVNICVQVFHGHTFLIPLAVYPGMEMLTLTRFSFSECIICF